MPSNANKRKRSRKRLEDEGEPEFQVAPMIDVLLVLTLFFMSITSTELLKKDKNLQLADANQAKPESRHHQPGQIVINVSWHGETNTAGFSIDGMALADTAALQGYLGRQMHADPNSYALVRADRDAQYSNIADVMSACAAVGISKVSFAVITTGNKMHHAAASAAAPQ